MNQLPSTTLACARRLRREATDAETLLWQLLRNRALGGFKFRRQQAQPPFVVDFYCAEHKLAVEVEVEVDGGQHADQPKAAHDLERTAILESRGIRVLRYWNDQVLAETELVLESIWAALNAP